MRTLDTNTLPSMKKKQNNNNKKKKQSNQLIKLTLVETFLFRRRNVKDRQLILISVPVGYPSKFYAFETEIYRLLGYAI